MVRFLHFPLPFVIWLLVLPTTKAKIIFPILEPPWLDLWFALANSMRGSNDVPILRDQVEEEVHTSWENAWTGLLGEETDGTEWSLPNCPSWEWAQPRSAELPPRALLTVHASLCTPLRFYGFWALDDRQCHFHYMSLSHTTQGG